MTSEIRAVRPIPINRSNQLESDRLVITNVKKFNVYNAPKGSNTQKQTKDKKYKLYIVLHWHGYRIGSTQIHIHRLKSVSNK